MNAFSPLQNLQNAEMIPDIVSWHGTIHSCGCRRRTTPCDAAWERAALRPGRRRRSNNLPQVIAREHRPLRRRPHWILPHVEPYPLDRDSSQSRWSGTGTEADPRAVRFLLECGSPIERTRLARAILLLPAGPVASLGGAAYRAQSGESRFGFGGGAVALVQRSLSLRRQKARRVFDAGAVAQPLTTTAWHVYLSAGETEARLAVIRQRTHTGRPLGTEEFIQDLEKVTQRRIALQKRGPREKFVTDRRQGELTFDP
jgi:hypothetical protein